jgi:SAM-dependent methyltransferase
LETTTSRTIEMPTTAEFDKYATNYDIALERGLVLTGEPKEYFAESRVNWLAGCLRALSEAPKQVMDFGCGGSGTALLLDILKPEFVIGLDTSEKLLESARQNCRSQQSRFLLTHEYQPAEQIDLAYCNGVFHHIPPKDRAEALDYIWRSLRSGGLFALWENNPWNPGTRFVMSRIPFDRDAVTLTSIATHRLLRTGGFDIMRTDYLFIFPKMLKWLRPIEPLVSTLPLGGQFQVLCRKQ